ncbi:MAG: SDR family NAD(P)-dependent oxidoreductase [Bdellovibrionales bacterium]|nr:SDR family NAD(P)-dependent oxidoreductase [Bdellovibrionales bacterium]
MNQPIAIITGANRGLGFEACRALGTQGYHIVMVGRDEQSLINAQTKLQSLGITSTLKVVDLRDSKAIEKFVHSLSNEFKQINILINNAGVLLETQETGTMSGLGIQVKRIDIENEFAVNTFAPLELMQKIIPLMMANNYGRIVNVSSGMGSLNEMNGGWPIYRASKAALNALTRIFAVETQSYNIKVNSVCPGWVKTDMGGENAARTIEEGIQGIIWAATLDEEGPTGGFFRDGKAIAW